MKANFPYLAVGNIGDNRSIQKLILHGLFKGGLPYIKNVDILYHEATYTEEHAQLAKKTYHSTATQAAKIAKLAEVGKLLIGHYSSRYKDTKKMLEEAKAEFPNTEATEDNSVYSIEFKRQK